MHRTRKSTLDSLERTTKRLERRLVAAASLRYFPAALALSIGSALGFAALLGPAPTRGGFAVALILWILPWPIFGVYVAATLRGFGGRNATRVLQDHDPWLASALRSALELSSAEGPAASLTELHRDSVARALAALNVEVALPIRVVARRALGYTALVLSVALIAAITEPHINSGLYALMHPMAERDGTRLALVVRTMQTRTSPPAHRGGAPTQAENPIELTLDEGASVDIDITLRVDAREVDIALGASTARLERVNSRRFRGVIVARGSGDVVIRARTSDAWLRDATARHVTVRDDAAPSVRIVHYSPESPIASDAEIELRYEASDDVGLAELTRVVRGPSGVEQRVSLAVSGSSPANRSVTGVTQLLVSELELRPGDAVTIVFEARDGDAVDGPKTTQSQPLTLTVDDGREARERATQDLRGLLETTLDALASRLESDVPADAAAMVARAERLAVELVSLAERVRSVEAQPSEVAGLSMTDRGFLRGLARKFEGLAAADRSAASRSATGIAAADSNATTVLEEASLAIAELLGRVELEDATAILRELASLQRELASLVQSLRERPSDATRNAVRATMDRIRRRMSELSSRLAAMQQELPPEFRNAAGAASGEASDALSSLEQAMASGDLDAADRSVAALESALREMARASSAADEDLEESGRFGPRQQAFGDAFARLVELETEQSALAGESARIRDGVSTRALEALEGGAVAGLAPLAAEARRIDDALRQLDRIGRVPVDQQSLDRARARLDDAREALAHGDLGEAQAMLANSTQTVEAIASDLDFSRRMFDESNGRIAGAADAARRAADALRALDDQVLRAIPDLTQHMRAADESALNANAARQTQAEGTAESIAGALASDEHGEPLAPEVSTGIREAAAMMAEASAALRARNTIDAAAAQTRAARRLRELREQVEQEHSSSGGGGGGSSESSGGGGGTSSSSQSGEQRVEVPVGSGSESAAMRRRRVLDAMGDDVPESYRGSVRRYYEELLR